MPCGWGNGAASSLLIRSDCCRHRYCRDGHIVDVLGFVAGPDGVGVGVGGCSIVHIVGANACVASLQPVQQNVFWFSVTA